MYSVVLMIALAGGAHRHGHRAIDGDRDRLIGDAGHRRPLRLESTAGGDQRNAGRCDEDVCEDLLGWRALWGCAGLYDGW